MDIWEKAREYDRIIRILERTDRGWLINHREVVTENKRLRELCTHLKQRVEHATRDLASMRRRKTPMATKMNRAQVITLSGIILHQLDIGAEVTVLGNDNYGGIIVDTPRGHYTLFSSGGHLLRDQGGSSQESTNACKSQGGKSRPGRTNSVLPCSPEQGVVGREQMQRVLEDDTIEVDLEMPDE